MQQILEAEALKFAYISEDETYHFALNGIDLSVKEGEFVVILGHNGSGKSTFARLVNALNTPTSGRLEVAGMDTSKEENQLAIRETAGMVFQNPDNQLVATVVDEEVAFGPENLGVPREEILERVQQSLEMVGMEQYRKRAPHMLSGGQKQRIAIASTLAMHPKMIIFDEATAMLDPKGRSDILEIIHQLNAQGMTILLITHFMEEAVDADQVVVMRGGFVLKKGTPQEIFFDEQLLQKAELLPPFAAQLYMDLKKKGIALNPALTREELAEQLCQLQ
ncbi:MAG: energy-coupling factor transporter ATPase [Clostridiales bacterium]|nr:energy-coupling factor transporter ATPase [Clostridiales bacterium]